MRSAQHALHPVHLRPSRSVRRRACDVCAANHAVAPSWPDARPRCRSAVTAAVSDESDVFVGIDLGTQGARALAVARDGAVAGRGAAALRSRRDGDRLSGCGTSDMKSGDAVLLHLAATLPEPSYDLTFVLYDNEEVEAERNGLKRLVETRRDLLDADLAVLMEPTDGRVEAGCQGTLRVRVTVPGRRAHSARGWLGENAIHAAAPLLTSLVAYEPRSVVIDGCTYREGLNAVRIDAGVAGNVIPDACTVLVNFRFAPDRSEEQAYAHVRGVFAGYDVELTDSAPGALPGLSAPAAQHFIAAIGSDPVANYRKIRRELELHSAALAIKPEVVAVSKSELTGSGEVRERLQTELGHDVLGISAVTGQGLSQLVSRVAQLLQETASEVAP
ncbi:MAG: succinyl-diaminopimelate desuccinylase [Actinobacteria bacterium]|nr:succinyl-diaminopimelate desuccinylase [Actinomycetota bacterium]